MQKIILSDRYINILMRLKSIRVIKIVTDSHLANMVATKVFLKKQLRIFWTSYVAHCRLDD